MHVYRVTYCDWLKYNLIFRFYGRSHPTEDMTTENMKYLSSRQGLKTNVPHKL